MFPTGSGKPQGWQEIHNLQIFVIPALRLPAKAGAQDKLPFGQAGIHHRQLKFMHQVMGPAFAGVTKGIK